MGELKKHKYQAYTFLYEAKIANWRLEIQLKLIKNGGGPGMADTGQEKQVIRREEDKWIQLIQTL